MGKFDDKVWLIIPQLCGKDFYQQHPKKGKVIDDLKLLRNDLIHLKHKGGEGMTVYQDVYQRILDIDMKRIINTVKFYINFHHPKLIQNRGIKTTIG